jgi:hypothetical protein
MKKLAWIALGSVLLLALVAALLFGAYLVFGLPDDIGRVTVNGELINLHGAHAGHWLLASLIVFVCLLVLMLLVPALLLLAFVVPLTLAAFGMLVGALLTGLVLSPLILLGWWLWKRRGKPETITA